MNRRWILSFIFILILVVLALFVRANIPSVINFSPNDGEFQIPVGSSIQLTFSGSMQPESVEQYLTIQPAVEGSFSWDGNILTFKPLEPWPSGEQINVVLQAGARSILGLPTLTDQEWSFTISPPLLAYLWPYDGPADLYAIDLIDNIAVRLTEEPNGILAYDISADGRHIYYSKRLNIQNSAIFRLDRINNAITQILLCENILCNFPMISPQSDYLAYTRAPSNPDSPNFPQQVWLLPVVDGELLSESQASLISDPLNRVSNPFWSPNGLLTYYDSAQQEFVIYDPQRDESRSLPNETGEPGTWAPDGSAYIVHEVKFWGDGPLDFNSHLWRFEYPSLQSRNLSVELAIEDVTPAFSPDGNQVAFGRRFLDPDRFIIGSQLWIMDTNGELPHQITDNPDYNHADFAWHPDGEFLAFVRHKQTTLIDPPEIWIILPDGTNAARLVIGGYGPQWIP